MWLHVLEVDHVFGLGGLAVVLGGGGTRVSANHVGMYVCMYMWWMLKNVKCPNFKLRLSVLAATLSPNMIRTHPRSPQVDQ